MMEFSQLNQAKQHKKKPMWPWKLILKTNVPKKMAVFGWIALNEACLTHDDLQRRSTELCSLCYFCKSDRHLQHFRFIWDIWYMFSAYLESLGDARELERCNY